MIKVIEKQKNKTKQNPYYLLEFNYMIGDADGHTEEEMTFGIEDADIVERFVKLINGLKPLSGTWGIVFERHEFHKFKNQLSEDDFNFLKNVMFENWGEEESEDDYTGYFSECIKGETEYSFLVFKGVNLYYYDENGIKYDTEFV
jgi:hypothetical protein